MAKAKTLEDFIKDYLNAEAKSLGADSYSKWVADQGGSAEATRASLLIKSDTDYKTALSGYGKNAEALSGAGLQKSGYARYLDLAAQESKKSADEYATLRSARMQADNIQGYESYLSDLTKEKERLYRSALSTLRSAAIPDFDTAYSRALELGLDENTAKRAAEAASAETSNKLKTKVVSAIVSKKMSADQARAYALELGLSETVADELASYAFDINESTVTGGAYLDYLKQILEND